MTYFCRQVKSLNFQRRPKTQIRRFLEIWQEPRLGTKLKICAKGYITIIKHNIEGTFHGQIQPVNTGKCRKTDKYGVPNQMQWAIPLSPEITTLRIVKAAP